MKGGKMTAGTPAEVRIEIDLAAPADKVYEAIATREGVNSWWTEGTFGEEVGDLGRLIFGAGRTELRVDRLVPGREVEWTCVGQSIEHFDPADEWVGTRISFLLDPLDEARTHLTFTHHGLAGLGCEEMCMKGWDHYIRTSLRALVETGQGVAGAGAGPRST
jgi:uncharacterized protein YndB with AHSA1/START domain